MYFLFINIKLQFYLCYDNNTLTALKINFRMLSIQANYHQGNTKLIGAGKQCAANSLAAMATAIKKSPRNWESFDMDNILTLGDSSYKSVDKSKYLIICELPKSVNMGYDVIIKRSYCGNINREYTEIPFYNLKDSLKDMPQFCFLTIDCYTVAIIKSDKYYYVFDSHSRNDCGMPCTKGKAFVKGIHLYRN
jgi:hypothetical protein